MLAAQNSFRAIDDKPAWAKQDLEALTLSADLPADRRVPLLLSLACDRAMAEDYDKTWRRRLALALEVFSVKQAAESAACCAALCELMMRACLRNPPQGIVDVIAPSFCKLALPRLLAHPALFTERMSHTTGSTATDFRPRTPVLAVLEAILRRPDPQPCQFPLPGWIEAFDAAAQAAPEQAPAGRLLLERAGAAGSVSSLGDPVSHRVRHGSRRQGGRRARSGRNEGALAGPNPARPAVLGGGCCAHRGRLRAV
jgi:hypothetical protein